MGIFPVQANDSLVPAQGEVEGPVTPGHPTENHAGESRRPALSFAGLLLTGLVLLAFAPLLAGCNFLPFARYPNWGTIQALDDGKQIVPDKAFLARKATAPWIADKDFVALSVFWPQDLATAHLLHGGRLPLWDPYTGGGYPTLDNGQYRPFNPFRWFFYLIPTNWAYCFSLFLTLVFGCWGAWRWFRGEGYDAVESLVGSAIFALNPWTLERLTILEPSAFALLPWCLLGLRSARWRDWPSLAQAALPFILLGQVSHPEPCLLVAAMAGGYFWLAEERGREEAGRLYWKRLGTLSVVGALTLAALAVLWVPLLWLLHHSFSYKEAGLPFLFEYSWKAPFALASDLYVAPALVALLAAAALAGRRASRYWLAVALAGLVLLMPLTAVGTAVKAFLQVKLFIIPLFYFKAFFWAGCAFLAPEGLRAMRRGARWVKALAWSAGGLALLGDLWLFGALPLSAGVQTHWPALAWVLIGAGLVAVGLLAMVQRRGKTTLALGALIVLPLAFPLSLDHLSWNSIAFRPNPTFQWLHRDRPHDRVVSLGWHPYFVLPPNQGQVFGVRAAEQNAAYFLNRYFQLFFNPPAPPTCIMYAAPEWLRFENMGASLLLLPEQTPLAGVQVVHEGGDARVYAIPGALGRLYFARAVAMVDPGQPLAKQIVALGHEADGVALVETMGQPAPSAWPEGPMAGGRLTFIHDGAERVTIAAEAPHEALLVLRDSWYPGWRASVDGRHVPIYRVNGCFRGVLVPAGKHEVRFVYRPWHVYIPAAVSLLVTLAVLWVALSVKRLSTSRWQLPPLW